MLPENERRAYAAHLESCSVCQAEVAASQSLRQQVRNLTDPRLSALEARSFDAAVMRRLGLGETAAMAAVAGIREQSARAASEQLAGARESAARSISMAARSRLDRRRFEPLFAPLPSLILVSLGLAAASMSAALFFGDVMVRALGSGFGTAAGSIWNQATWLATAAVHRLFELMVVFGVAGDICSQARPWLEACQLLLATYGREIAVVGAVTSVLILFTAWRVRRQHGRVRRS